MLPEALIAQFRTVARERLVRIEDACTRLRAGADPAASQLLQREVHTLKGESQVLGFPEVAAACRRIEELVASGGAPDEVTATLRAIAALLT